MDDTWMSNLCSAHRTKESLEVLECPESYPLVPPLLRHSNWTGCGTFSVSEKGHQLFDPCEITSGGFLRGTPSYHPFSRWDFPHQKPSILGYPIYGNPQVVSSTGFSSHIWDDGKRLRFLGWIETTKLTVLCFF